MNPAPPKEEPEPDEAKSSALVEGDAYTDALTLATESVGITVPDDKQEVLKNFMKASRFGHQATLPMKCQGQSCPFLNICPLHQIGVDLPKGKACPVESSLLSQWVGQFLDTLDIDEDEIGNSVEVHMVYELAGLELMRRRAAAELSEDPKLTHESIVGFSPQGQPIYDVKPSQALLILERHSKIVNKLRESLLATPKSQAQAGQLRQDLSTRTANTIERAKKIIEDRIADRSIKDTEFKVVSDEETEAAKDSGKAFTLPSSAQEQGEGSGE